MRKSSLFPVATFALAVGLNACGGGNGGSSGSPGAGGGTPSTKAEVVYVGSGSGGAGQILAFSISASGVLGNPIPFGGPQYTFDLKADPASTFLYGADFNQGKIVAYSINASTGALMPANGSPFSSPLQSGNGGPIAISPNGKFLFSSDATGDIATFAVNTNGTLTPGVMVHDSNQPLQLVVDPSSKFVFAANMSDSSGNEISAFSIDPNNGTLTPITGSPFTFRNNSGPFGITVHSSGKFLYTALTNASSVAALSIDSTGAVSSIAGSPFKTQFIPSGVAIDPSGKFLYVSNKGLGSISAFTIDALTGVLTEMPNSPFVGGGPDRIAIDPQGKFLFAVYPNFHQLATYNILANGSLGSPSVVSAGDAPTALTAVQLP